MKIGIDIGGSHIAIGVINKTGEIVEKTEKNFTEDEKQNIENIIEEYIIEHYLEFIKKYEIELIGIAMPGTAINGVIVSSGNVGIKNYSIIEKLHKKIDVPIIIRNDAKCAAIAENKYGCLKEYNRSIFLTLGTGIGGAAFLDNKLIKAGIRPGYEFGHMVIQKDGIQCVCGRKGCFERYASMKAFKNNLREALGLTNATRGEELLNIIKNNNKDDDKYQVIEDVISEYIEDLSLGIINLINIFEPEVIGIGGSFVHFQEVLLGRLKEKINSEMAGETRRNIIIKTAILENDAGIIGAVCDE